MGIIGRGIDLLNRKASEGLVVPGYYCGTQASPLSYDSKNGSVYSANIVGERRHELLVFGISSARFSSSDVDGIGSIESDESTPIQGSNKSRKCSTQRTDHNDLDHRGPIFCRYLRYPF